MDYFSDDILVIPSIAPDLMFADDEELIIPCSPEPQIHIQEKKQPVILTHYDRETILQFVFNDHTYAKPYPVLSCVNYKLKTPLSVMKLTHKDFPDKKKQRKLPKTKQVQSDDEIDVETVEKPPLPVVKYDVNRARSIMNEVETYLHSLWKDVDKDDEEKIIRACWSRDQTSLFDSSLKILNNYQLAKLAYVKNENEPVLRRIALDKATKRLRKVFGSTLWNAKLVVWLHGIMIDGLGSSLFLCYLEVLQSLKRKVPALFEKVILSDKTAVEKEITAGLPNLAARLRKSWEPSVGIQTKVSMQKFKTIPFLIVIPSGPSIPHQSTKRNRFWNNQLMNIGKTIPINIPAYRTPEGYVIKYYIEHCISTVRANIVEFRTRFPDRHVVLIGWGVGSLIAFKIALIEKVDAIVCLGFPCKGLGHTNEEYWKNFTKIECPVLFFIGSHALTNSMDKTEELREKMKTQTNLIVVESADEMLRLSKSNKRTLGMTQNMIDKLLQDEIYLFLKDVLFKPKPICKPPVKTNQSPKKRKKKPDLNEPDAKKKKKNNPKTQLTIQARPTSTGLLKTVDGIGQITSSVVTSNNQALLMTGSISTTIPVTQLQNETLVSPSVRVVGQHVISTDSKMSPKVINQKKPKEKSKSKSKKTASQRTLSSSQNFTANLGTYKSGNLTAQRFANADLGNAKVGSQQQVTVQRVPAGSFVLSGASGHVRLQGGTNLVYLQQATSGTTQLIHTPLVANSSGTFTAVLTTTAIGSSSSTFTFVPAHTSKGINQDQPQQKTESPVTVQLQTHKNKQVTSPSGTIEIISNPASISNTGLSIATTNPVNTSAIATSTIMTHLSASDLRYLATLIAKHNSSRPNSPIQTGSPGMTSPLAERLNVSLPSPSTKVSVTNLPSPVSKTSNVSQWPQMLSSSSMKSHTISSSAGKKSPLLSSNQSLKKITYPPSLIQKVAAAQHQRDAGSKLKTPVLRPPRIVTNTATANRNNASATAMATKILASISSGKSGQKIPVTLNIPVSKLSTTMSTTALTKSISVPGLSAYLSQQRFVLTSSKAGSTNRTVILSPGLGRKDSSTSTKIVGASSDGSSVTTGARTVLVSTQTRPYMKSSSTVTLNLSDSSALRKAASDIKLIGLLNEHTKKIKTSTLQPLSLPSSPSSLTDEELSPITPRKPDEINNFEQEGISPLKVFTTPRSAIESLKPNNTMTKLMSKHSEETDVDFAVLPTARKRSMYPLNKPVTVESSKYVDVAKLLKASLGQLSRVNNNQVGSVSPAEKAFSKNLLEIAKGRLQDVPKSETTKSLNTNPTLVMNSTNQTPGAKLRFEPLAVSGNRSKLSSVLSSMRETGKIVIDENGKMRATIIAKPLMVKSEAPALISKTALITTSTQDLDKSTTVLSVTRSTVTAESVSQPLFSLSNSKLSLSTSNSNVHISSPITSSIMVSSTTNLLQSVSSIKTTDFVRIPSQRMASISVVSPSLKSPSITEKSINKDVPSKLDILKADERVDEDDQQPAPYVTRSGRVLKNRYPDDNDRKVTPRKRRRTLSSGREDGQPRPKQVNLTSNQEVISMSATGNLDCLLEAANLIKIENETSQNTSTQGSTINPPVVHMKSKQEILHVDSTTSIAATAMLELLSSEAKLNRPNMKESNKGTDHKSELSASNVAFEKEIIDKPGATPALTDLATTVMNLTKADKLLVDNDLLDQKTQPTAEIGISTPVKNSETSSLTNEIVGSPTSIINKNAETSSSNIQLEQKKEE